jgi:hypothetical protein
MGRGGQEGRIVMKEILRSNDPVLMSAVSALLDAAVIRYLVFDQNMSVLEGSIGILPRRILVEDDREGEARQLLAEAGLGNELRPQDDASA